MTEVEQPPPQNGIDLSGTEDDDNNKSRPADIEQDMREMERRKRVEAIMGSKLFREELERIVDSARDGGTSGILQQLSDIVGIPTSRVGSVYKASNCLMPINDIRGVESMGYAKGEKILRCKLAATFRLLDLYGWTRGLGAQITARLKVDQEYFLVNPYGLLYHEITASSLNKVDMQGNVVEQGTTNFGVNKSHFVLHSVVHAARPDIRCAIYIGCSPVVAVSSLKAGLLPITRDACVLGEVTTHSYSGALDNEERDRLIRNLGPNSKVMLLTNHGALCCGETIEEAFHAACHIVQACETQLKLLPVGLDNLSLIPEESRKTIYEQSRRPPEDLAKKFAAASTAEGDAGAGAAAAAAAGTGVSEEIEAIPKIGAAPKWRVGGAEFEALMRMLDNAGYRTGYIYRHPLIKSEPPKPKNDVELPPAVSSLGYLLEEEELFRQGIWKKGDLRKGGDRSRWLNSPNVYQKVEVLETGTPDPKKITKWVAEGSPTHSTPVRIEDPLQFVPAGTNPKEFKRLQQQIKDNRRADKISAGPQSHILEGVTWDEANRIRDATVSSTGDHVVLVGAASKGIIQRGFQHNATVYKAPYAKNPFDNVTDDELNEYKRTVERKKKSIHGEYTDTDFSESEALSSLPPAAQGKHGKTAGATQSEPEDMGAAHQVMRIETQQAPIPSQPEVVLSDAMKKLQVQIPVDENVPLNIPQRELQDQQANFLSNDSEEAHLQGESFRETEKAKLNQEISKEISNISNTFDNVQREDASLLQATNENQSKFNYFEDHLSFVSGYSDSEHYNKPNDSSNLKILSSSNTVSSSSHNTKNDEIDNKSKNQRLNVEFSNDYEHCLPILQHGAFSSTSTSSNYETIYETIGSENTQSAIFEAEAVIYKPSIECTTQTICEKIFESLLLLASTETVQTKAGGKPTTKIEQYHCHKRGRNAHRTYRTYRTNIEPYRTLSHFGFNSPKRSAGPEHKHLPPNGLNSERTYIPLRRTLSYEEIFSSPRYKDLCEPCFDKIVRIKPNWFEMNGRKVESLDGCSYIDAEEQNSLISDNFNSSEDSVGTIPDYDYVITESGHPPIHSRRLETLIEMDENDNENKSVGVNASFDSTFLNKIMRMNFSEESAGDGFHLKAITSKISDLSVMDNSENHNASNTSIQDINDTVNEGNVLEEYELNYNSTMSSFGFDNFHPIAHDEDDFITKIDDFQKFNKNHNGKNDGNRNQNQNREQCNVSKLSKMGIEIACCTPGDWDCQQIVKDSRNMEAISVSNKSSVDNSCTNYDFPPYPNINESGNVCFSNKTCDNAVSTQNTLSRVEMNKQLNLNGLESATLERLKCKNPYRGLVFSTTTKTMNPPNELVKPFSRYSHSLPKAGHFSDGSFQNFLQNDEKEIFHEGNYIFPFENYESMRQAIKENINNYQTKFLQIQEYTPDELLKLKAAWDLESNFNSFNGERRRSSSSSSRMNENNGIESNMILESSNDNAIGLSDKQLDQIEREVLTKIKHHNLKETEGGEIFGRIEEAIRSKMSSKQIEKWLHKQHENVHIVDVATLERKLIAKSYLNGLSHSQKCGPQEKNIHPTHENFVQQFNKPSYAVKTKYNNQPNDYIQQQGEKQLMESYYSGGKHVQMSTPRRKNFIHENIRNASKKRESPKASPRNTTPSSHSEKPTKKRNLTSVLWTQHGSQSQQGETSAHIYPFQPKIRRNSTRILINIPTETAGNNVTSNLSIPNNKRKKSSQRASSRKQFCGADEGGNVLQTPSQNPTKVDVEIEALGAQIREIEPKVNGIKLMCDEYGENVAKCSRTLDECITLQSNCIEENFHLMRVLESNSISEIDD